MQIIRTIAVGILISAFLMEKFSAEAGLILPAAFIAYCYCLGVGLGIAGILYPLSEGYLIRCCSHTFNILAFVLNSGQKLSLLKDTPMSTIYAFNRNPALWRVEHGSQKSFE